MVLMDVGCPYLKSSESLSHVNLVLSGRQNWSGNYVKLLMPWKVTGSWVEGLIVLFFMDFGSWGCHHPQSGRVESHAVKNLEKCSPMVSYFPLAYGTCSSEHAELRVDITKLQLLIQK